ncbi:MAG: hypothetical protein RR937_05185 [Ruthenibacterium sp.]
MTISYICKEVERVKRRYDEADPLQLAKAMGVLVQYGSFGINEHSCKPAIFVRIPCAAKRHSRLRARIPPRYTGRTASKGKAQAASPMKPRFCMIFACLENYVYTKFSEMPFFFP